MPNLSFEQRIQAVLDKKAAKVLKEEEIKQKYATKKESANLTIEDRLARVEEMLDVYDSIEIEDPKNNGK